MSTSQGSADDVGTWEGIVEALARRYFAPGLTREDICQEARLGVWEGINGWDPDGGRSLKNFIWLTAERSVITAVKTATRGKHGPLNEAQSMDAVLGATESVTLHDLMGGPSTETEALGRAELTELRERIETELTPAEGRALLGPGLGFAYEECGASGKTVDNARQRAKLKLSRPRPAGFRQPQPIGSTLQPDPEETMDTITDPMNPIAEATEEQIAATEEWREAQIAKIREAADAQIEILQEILKRAQALPMNGSSPTQGPPDGGAKRVSGLGAPGAATRTPPPSTASRPASPSPDRPESISGYAQKREERRKALLRVIDEAGKPGIAPRAIEAKVDMPKGARQKLLNALVDEGRVHREGSRKSLRYYGREPEPEDSPAG